MKRRTILGIIALAVLAAFAVLLFPCQWTQLPQENAVLAVGADGGTFLAYSREKSVILQIQADGNIADIYTESARTDTGKTVITALGHDGEKTYFIRATGPVAGAYTGWELVRLDMAAHTVETLYTGNEIEVPVSLNIADGMAYLASIGTMQQAGEPVDTVISASLDLETEQPELEILYENAAPERQAIRTAAMLSSGGTVASLEDGKMFVSTQEGATYLSQTGQYDLMHADNAYLWAYDGAKQTVLSGNKLYLNSSSAPAGLLAGTGSQQNGTAWLYYADGSVCLAREHDDQVLSIETLGMPAGVRMQLRLYPAVLAALGMLALGFVVSGIVLLIRRRKQLKWRLAASGVLLTMVVCAAMLFSALVWTRDSISQQRLEGAAQAVQRLEQRLAQDQPFAARQVYGSGLEQSQELLVYYPVEQETLGAPQGDRALYQTGLAQRLVDTALRTKEPAAESGYLMGSQTAFAAAPVISYDTVTGIVVAAVTGPDIADEMHDMQQKVVIVAVILFVLFSVCFYLLLYRGLRPMRELTHRMDDLVVGCTTLKEVSCADDEVGAMWRNLKELSVGMAIRDYETRTTLESCRRFVPQGLDKLLNRATITEVSFGDSATISGPVGLIMVKNGDQARDQLDDRQFMSFVNSCYSAISRNVRSQEGILLTAGFDLKSLRVLYTQGADSGLQSAMSLLGEDEDAQPSGALRPGFFIQLHLFRLLYGIAGTEEEAFPYVASAELEFFSGYAKFFAAAGCRIVVTDAYRAQLSGRYSMRYIGFISSGDGKFVYKLYEALDCYSDLERAQREQYDSRMQEAIACFYKRDFYLARNLFLAILRVNPDDGIARWYLFASEHYFNSPVGEEPRYDLFGIHE